MFNIEINKTEAFNHDGNDKWLNIINSQNNNETTRNYIDIYKKHHKEKKWILMINPEDKSLLTLSKIEKLASKNILQVNSNKVKLGITGIKTALKKGNCSAVILCNANLETNELSQLNHCAKKGKTPCIVLNQITSIH